MVFVTNRYIYTPEKKEKILEIKGISFKSYLDDEFKIGVEERIRKKYEEVIDYNNFYENFKILGDVAFYDEDVLIVNNEIIYHNFLSVKRKREIFNDISDIEEFLKNNINDKFILITDEDISLNHISVKEALIKLESFDIKSIFIKISGNYVEKKLPFSFVGHHINDIVIKYKKEKLLKLNLNGAGFLKFKKRGNSIILNVANREYEIGIEELI